MSLFAGTDRMLPETAATREIWWTGMAVPGMLLSIWTVCGAVADLLEHRRTVLETLAWIGLGKVTCVMLMGGIVIAVGLIAMGTPEPINPENIESAEQSVPLLLVLDFLILALAILFWAERRWVAGDIHVLRRAREERQRREAQRASVSRADADPGDRAGHQPPG
jgi:hypothetical protein